ncbi:alternative ribosome rescue aminoacyl-tRNA hydrolase ArfB [Aquimarina sp. 2-A2]|uniref:alternative ribosome rescue aminoacyl-tRNA hydrolase ArfB n=1 Tax=Aquimarina sp. 2-A2 TaxID=3382644 RepID=UPI00387F27AE
MKTDVLLKELEFKATRSSGAGGQHVNKVSTKIVVRLHIDNSQGFTLEEKQRLRSKLASRISNEGYLQLSCDASRNQHRNKNLAIQRLLEMLKASLVREKVRKSTKPSRASIQKRLDSKKKQSQRKENRRNPDF